MLKKMKKRSCKQALGDQLAEVIVVLPHGAPLRTFLAFSRISPYLLFFLIHSSNSPCSKYNPLSLALSTLVQSFYQILKDLDTFLSSDSCDVGYKRHVY